ncbi:MAG: hypothetical protein RIE86_02940 [Imperialibacter sp.]|uniref:hypothetical protein n=1 Tax=Imperialibacter sp. TaxID=2038411 RepID=UPI0032EC8315
MIGATKVFIHPIDQSAPAKFYAVVNATGEVNQRDISQEIAERSTVTLPTAWLWWKLCLP